LFYVAFIVILAVIFINGFTDAANAIATAVGTKAIRMKQACILSAVMNFAGVFITSFLRPAVADSLYNMINMNADREEVFLFVAVSMFSVLVWAVAAWFFGIPTSESHALIASLTGCAVAVQGGFAAVNKAELYRVFFGLFFSVFIGFFVSYGMQKMSRNLKNIKTRHFQITIAAALSFLHGAQDGQKFLGVLMLLFAYVNEDIFFKNSLAFILCCAVFMGLGTLCGGKRIVLSVGENITPLNGLQGIISDFSACIGMTVCTYSGLPVSTTHVKTMSVVGVGFATDSKKVNKKLITDIILTWGLTFPGCAFLGYLLTKLFLLRL